VKVVYVLYLKKGDIEMTNRTNDNNAAVIGFLAFIFAMFLGAIALWFLNYRGFVTWESYKVNEGRRGNYTSKEVPAARGSFDYDLDIVDRR
jgi:hypothetical protein